jgi:hypothetical protein
MPVEPAGDSETSGPSTTAWGAQNESRAFLESLRAVERFAYEFELGPVPDPGIRY